MQLGRALRRTQDPPDHLGPEAGAAHAEQDDILILLGLLAELGERGLVDLLALGGGQPAEPLGLVAAGPHRRIVRPQLARPALLARLFDRLLDGRGEILGQIGGHRVELLAEELRALVGDRAVERIRRIGEALDAALDEAGGDAGQVEPEPLGLAQDFLGAIEIGGDRLGGLAMVAERVHRLGRHGVDRVAADQRLDIEHVRIARVLGAGRRPQQPLRHRALGGERLPARRGRDFEIMLIGHLGIGDRDLAAHRLERLDVVAAGLDLLVDRLVDRAVDAADEEARDRGDLVDRLTLGDARLEAGDIGLEHRLVGVDREQQRDVDVDAVLDRHLDRGQAGLGARDLDHQILAVDRLPQPPRGVDRVVGRHREIGRDLDRDIAVLGVERLVHRGQGIAGGRGCRRWRASHSWSRRWRRPRRCPSRAARHRRRSGRSPSRRSSGWR